jgi:carbamoyltransferase
LIILGLNAFHGDSSAAILKDGEIVAAVEEERFRRIKHWAGFPTQSIKYCLEAAGVSISDVEHVAINQDSSANLSKKISYTLGHRPDLGLIMDRIRNKKKRASVPDLLREAFPGAEVGAEFHPVEHHLAHLSSAFHCSPFEAASVVSVDGFGDFASAAWGRGEGVDIEVEGRVYFPHSMGIFYQALTQFLGFPNYGDEYKVMGLASYGKPTYLDQMREIVLLQEDGTFKLDLGYFVHHKEKIDYSWEDGYPTVGQLWSEQLPVLLGTPRAADTPIEQQHMDLAHSVQAMYEQAFFHLLNSMHGRHGHEAVAVAGGCGMNSVANGRIRANTPFKRSYIQAAAGDAGGAIGAANVVWHKLGNTERKPMSHALLGPQYTAQDYAETIETIHQSEDQDSFQITRFEDDQALCDSVVGCIQQGGVIGWFQGRMEWGPRALGNRSILGDPRRSDMKDILNLKIKRRESFRPFAPSVLREYVDEWFEEDDDVPFMMKVFPIREDKRAQIPAVTHVDGSGRLQTVHRETNPLYWQLIDTFRSATGVPMLLNTSFNENEPIVCSPREALDCFLRTNMDMLVLGNTVVSRETNSLS